MLSSFNIPVFEFIKGFWLILGSCIVSCGVYVSMLKSVSVDMTRGLIFSVAFVQWLIGYDLFWIGRKVLVWLGGN